MLTEKSGKRRTWGVGKVADIKYYVKKDIKLSYR
jgi:hypothetical protein